MPRDRRPGTRPDRWLTATPVLGGLWARDGIGEFDHEEFEREDSIDTGASDHEVSLGT